MALGRAEAVALGMFADLADGAVDFEAVREALDAVEQGEDPAGVTVGPEDESIETTAGNFVVE